LLEILAKNKIASKAWRQLEGKICPENLKSVSHHLEAFANGELIFPWRPASRRQAQRFADHLERDAHKVEHMNLHFGACLPLANPALKNLGETLRRYAQVLRVAAKKTPKLRPPNDFTAREIEILRLVEHYDNGKVQSHFRQAADLIQAACDAGGLRKEVNAEQLRMLYERQSLRYRLQRRVKKCPSGAE
jgi:hypothetical protein